MYKVTQVITLVFVLAGGILFFRYIDRQTVAYERIAAALEANK